jgi:ABC-2 type transport system ATP-binding protein
MRHLIVGGGAGRPIISNVTGPSDAKEAAKIMPSTAPLLLSDRLTKDYGRLRALDKLNLQIGPGEVFGLLGPNGSGKSTAIRLFLGFLRPTAGRIAVAGHDSWHDGVAARKNVAYLPGELRLYENMTGRQIVAFLARLRGRPVNGELNALAKRFDIDLSRPLVQLSSGMKRKVALLSVLLPRVPLLILDEPTNTLDPTMRDELLGLLRVARDGGQSVLFSSHVLAEAEQLCDRVGILRNGKLVHLQSMPELNVEERLIRIHFRGSPKPWPDLPGIEVLQRSDTEARLAQRGPLAPLLAWLGDQAVADLRIEPLGLSGVYARYHGAEE